MDVLEAIQKRISVRAYQDRPIPEDKLRGILEAARLAPSARNSQDYQLIVVRDQKIRKELAAGIQTTQKIFLNQISVLVNVALGAGVVHLPMQKQRDLGSYFFSFSIVLVHRLLFLSL